MTRWFVMTSIAIGLTLSAPQPQWATVTKTKEQKKATAKISFKQKLCKLSGVCCLDCAKHLKKGLKAIPGVKKVSMDFKKQEANVRFDPGKVTEDTLAQAIEKLGFSCEIMSDATPETENVVPENKNSSEPKAGE